MISCKLTNKIKKKILEGRDRVILSTLQKNWCKKMVNETLGEKSVVVGKKER